MSAKEFYLNDFMKTLFPLKMNRYLVENGAEKIENHIKKCLSSAEEDQEFTFLSQVRVYAAKSGNHLRRTVKLDPVAEFFLYDMVYRNRGRFRAPFAQDKKHFGYRFSEGKPLNASDSYSGFKGAIAAYRKKFRHSLSFDVASYFNSVYHHDIVSWMSTIGVPEVDYGALGKFLREANSGRSIDCLPQGLYPSKMIGNDFLRFVEQHFSIKSGAVVRFMDDFVLFADSEAHLWEDFFLIQKLLGEKGLSVNPGKTKFGIQENVEIDQGVDDIKARLLQARRVILSTYAEDGSEVEHEIREEEELTEEEIGFIRDLLNSNSLEEDDAELILSIFKDHPDEVKPHLPGIAHRFPHLAKNVWSFCSHIDDLDFIAELVLGILKSSSAQEYQIFWAGHILEDYLIDHKDAPQLIELSIEHKNSTSITMAKILEIPSVKYGLPELRDSHLGAGKSDWLAWASAVGHRSLPAVARNHKLNYFANSSKMNYLIFSILNGK